MRRNVGWGVWRIEEASDAGSSALSFKLKPSRVIIENIKTSFICIRNFNFQTYGPKMESIMLCISTKCYMMKMWSWTQILIESENFFQLKIGRGNSVDSVYALIFLLQVISRNYCKKVFKYPMSLFTKHKIIFLSETFPSAAFVISPSSRHNHTSEVVMALRSGGRFIPPSPAYFLLILTDWGLSLLSTFQRAFFTSLFLRL